MKIGDKLKQGRTNKNLTQEEVGKIINVSRSTVSSWEVSRTYPDLEMLVALSDLYEISLDTMLREDERMVQSLSEEIRTSRKRKRWRVFSLAIYLLILIFYVYLLLQGEQIISMKQIEIYFLKRVDLISLLMISSLGFGLISWGLPLWHIIRPQKIENHDMISTISISFCAIAISFQVIYHNLMLQTGDIAGLLDTSGTITVLTIILLLETILFNSLSCVAKTKSDVS